jgi:hypothetical protein
MACGAISGSLSSQPLAPQGARGAGLEAVSRRHFVLGLDGLENGESESHVSPNETSGFAGRVVSH